ncbi:methyltransferase domain-containing protein [Mesorhizobium sp. WSM2239]|uniref:Methyltransferase domain-containing protein n=2 Tax=unclassified Mesorhizobium TaxID=325217 RepID=A0AAU8D7Y5_9HYPH
MQDDVGSSDGTSFAMPVQDRKLWGASDAYERYMGRWSRRIARIFTEWLDVGPGERWLDVGCGTGVLSSAILARSEPAEIVGIDSSETFLNSARTMLSDERVRLMQGDAQALPQPDNSFDAAVCGLVLNFVPNKEAALREMVRVVRRGGITGLYVWDYAGHMQVMRTFFDVATRLDPGASEYDDGVKAPICRPGPLQQLFERAELDEVEVRAIDIPAAFQDFDDYWSPFLGGTGSAPKYCLSLDSDTRERLRDELERRLPTGPDGEILLAIRAWGVKGRVR